MIPISRVRDIYGAIIGLILTVGAFASRSLLLIIGDDAGRFACTGLLLDLLLGLLVLSVRRCGSLLSLTLFLSLTLGFLLSFLLSLFFLAPLGLFLRLALGFFLRLSSLFLGSFLLGSSLFGNQLLSCLPVDRNGKLNSFVVFTVKGNAVLSGISLINSVVKRQLASIDRKLVVASFKIVELFGLSRRYRHAQINVFAIVGRTRYINLNVAIRALPLLSPYRYLDCSFGNMGKHRNAKDQRKDSEYERCPGRLATCAVPLCLESQNESGNTKGNTHNREQPRTACHDYTHDTEHQGKLLRLGRLLCLVGVLGQIRSCSKTHGFLRSGNLLRTAHLGLRLPIRPGSSLRIVRRSLESRSHTTFHLGPFAVAILTRLSAGMGKTRTRRCLWHRRASTSSDVPRRA